MITPDYVRMMARYNAWQNGNMLAVAEELSEEERRRDTGAAFRSLHETASHILWGDHMWLHRLTGHPAPEANNIAEGLTHYKTWAEFVAERRRTDDYILNWAAGLKQKEIDGEMAWYSVAEGRDMHHQRAPLIVHLFNHQTHHRGQIHAILTALGKKPGITDIPFMPETNEGAA